MEWQDWAFLIGIVLFVLNDIFRFLYKIKLEEDDYQRTLKDVTWNRDNQKD